MKLETRRHFLESALGGIAAATLGPPGGLLRPPDVAAQGRLIDTVPFIGEGAFSLDETVGSGLGRRRALDLSSLTPGTLVTPNDRFFIRTAYPDQLRPSKSWKISVRGLVETPVEFSLKDLLSKAADSGTHLIECAGNTRSGHFGLISAAAWTGVPVRKLLQRVRVLPRATRVLISGSDQHSREDPDSMPGASWVFTLEDLEVSGAFFALGMNGAPLSPDHGHPIRLVVPGWYGCACIKWVDEIELLDDEAPATSQMLEFARRIHQNPFERFVLRAPRSRRFQPVLARDFKPAKIDPAALPVRVERRVLQGKPVYRVVGILWGGDRLIRSLVIRFNPDMPYVPVEACDQRTNATWTLWSHTFRPAAPDRFRIQLAVSDKEIETRRLDMGYYVRTIDITEV